MCLSRYIELCCHVVLFWHLNFHLATQALWSSLPFSHHHFILCSTTFETFFYRQNLLLSDNTTGVIVYSQKVVYSLSSNILVVSLQSYVVD